MFQHFPYMATRVCGCAVTQIPSRTHTHTHMQSLHKYVPCGIVQGDYDDETATSSVQVAITSMHYLLFGGDQLTVSRVRGCHGIRKNSITPQGTLQGLQPVIEDWHAKMYLHTVIYMERSIRKWVLWILFYNIKFKSIHRPKY